MSLNPTPKETPFYSHVHSGTLESHIVCIASVYFRYLELENTVKGNYGEGTLPFKCIRKCYSF